MIHPDQAIANWARQGKNLTVPGAGTMAWQEGTGQPVVCLHGVPTSAFVYKKVLHALAAQGMRGIAFDFPGTGLAERPEEMDYSWSGLAAWTVQAIEALEVGRFHLVVHDIGGPVGFDVIRRMSDRILSLTVLNTMVHVASFKRPWFMEPLAHDGIGHLYVKMMRTPVFPLMMQWAGTDGGATTEDLAVHGRLITREDGGRALVKIMQGFERTKAYEERILATLSSRNYPAQVIWGAHDPALRMNHYAPAVCRALRLDNWTPLHGKHFIQEDAPEEIAKRIARLIS